MFIRFVIQKNHEDSGRKEGFFQALRDLNEDGTLFDFEKSQYDELKEWFNKNLKKPRSFSRSSKPHAKNVAISWFKDTAVECISRMHLFAQILRAHDVPVEILQTDRPGYIVYEDSNQVAAEPFKETVA